MSKDRLGLKLGRIISINEASSFIPLQKILNSKINEYGTELKENSISINLSSIYKILDSLSNKNVISKCILGVYNKTSYEMNTSEHRHHLICKQCREVFPITDCPLCIYEKHLRDDMDFDVTEHRLEIYGYCKNCKKMTKEYNLS